MDRPTLSIEILDPPQAHARQLSSPDPEARGRRRRRDPLSHHFARPPRARQSSALRGRGRHRSPSRLSLAGCVSRAGSSSRQHPGGDHSPITAGAAAVGSPMSSPTAENRRYLGVLATMPENHRRSRSPSRSRSPGRGGGAGMGKGAAEVLLPYVMSQRRRQRTQSRSRRHGLEEAFASGGRAVRSPLVGSGMWSTDAGTSEEV